MSTAVYATSPVKRTRRTRAQLATLDEAIVEIVEQMHPITVRGTFYQMEVIGLVPKDEKGYDVVQRELLKLRRAKVIPYGRITDGTRYVHRHQRWDGVGDFARHAAQFYRRDYWLNSPVNVEVWIEKDALAGVIFPVVAEEWGLELFVQRGFSSATYLHSAGESIAHDGRPHHVYVLGDFDPSGVCSAEKVAEKLPESAGGVEVYVHHLAVTMDQVTRWALPTRKVKWSDSRAKKFVARFGEISVELDAIPPTRLRQLVGEAIARHADREAIDRLKMIEAEEREALVRMAGDHWYDR